MTEPALVSALAELGFTLNESRAYHALLLESPATGYEVAARAQIPRSAVYGVLRRLASRGVARSQGGTPERFVPSPADHVLGLLRQRFEHSATSLEAELRRLDVRPPVPDAFTIRGYERVLEEAERVVHGATGRLALSGWPRELARLSDALRAAARRGVFTVVFSHATPPRLPGCKVFSYELDEAGLERFWKHRLSVVADDRHALVASAEQGGDEPGVVSQLAPIAEVVTSQIALDITLLSQRIKKDVRAVMERLLGERVGGLDSLLAARER